MSTLLGNRFVPQWVSYEAYISGRLVTSVLASISESALTNRSSFVEVVFQRALFLLSKFSLGPYWIPGCNQGIHSVWLTRINDTSGAFVSIGQFRFQPMSCTGNRSALPPVLIFGQSTALSGTSQIFGQDMKLGIAGAFQSQNFEGGVQGHRLMLNSLDDGYLPANCSANTEALVSTGNVMDLLGYFGTSTTLAALPIAVNASIPLIGPYTGTDALRKPFRYFAVNLRASYADEINALMNYITTCTSYTRFSVFYQDDSFGQAGVEALQAALRAVNFKLLSSGKYPRGTVEVLPGLEQILGGAAPVVPEVILVQATMAPGAAFVLAAKARLPSSTVYLLTSPAGPDPVLALLGSATQNVVFSQVVPSPRDPQSVAAANFRTTLATYSPSVTPSFISFEAYISARFTIAVLERMDLSAGNQLSMEFLQTIYDMALISVDDLEFGPFSTSDGSACNQGLRKVWIYRVGATGYYEEIPNSRFTFTGCFSDPDLLLPKFLLFGQSAALSGTLGAGLGQGLRAAFAEQNRLGGVYGHQLRLVSMDDGGDPSLCLNNTASLLQQQNVAGLAGYLGDSSAEAVRALLGGQSIPLIGATAGSEQFRTMFSPNVINIRASIMDEINALLSYVVQNTPYTRISLLYTSDRELSSEAVAAWGVAFTELNIVRFSSGSYHVLSNSSISGADPGMLLREPFAPEVIAVSVASEAAISLLRVASQRYSRDTLYLLTSEAVSLGLLGALPGLNVRTVVSHVVPVPSDPSSRLASAYRAALAAVNSTATPEFASLEGYVVGRFISSVLKRMAAREVRNASKFVEAIYATSIFVVEGVALGPFLANSSGQRGCNQGLKTVWMSGSQNLSVGGMPEFDFPPFSCSSATSSIPSFLTFGQSAALSGASAISGAELRDGILAAFGVANGQGGVDGHKLALVSLDDGYTPLNCSMNTLTLVKDLKVYGLLGYFGSGTTQAALPIAANFSVPIIGAYTGADFIRSPITRFGVNLRASYGDEINALVLTRSFV